MIGSLGLDMSVIGNATAIAMLAQTQNEGTDAFVHAPLTFVAALVLTVITLVGVIKFLDSARSKLWSDRFADLEKRLNTAEQAHVKCLEEHTKLLQILEGRK